MKVGFVFNILDRHWQMFGRRLHAPIQAVFQEQGVKVSTVVAVKYCYMFLKSMSLPFPKRGESLKCFLTADLTSLQS